MVNFSSALLTPFQLKNPGFSIFDLTSLYRGCRYADETIKMLPEKPDDILEADKIQQIVRFGAVHPVFQPSLIP